MFAPFDLSFRKKGIFLPDDVDMQSKFDAKFDFTAIRKISIF